MKIVLFLFLGLYVSPAPAWALQAHGGPEGLHAHQMAHLFFAFSMGLLIYWLRKHRLAAEQGWKFIKYAAILFIMWNIDAFAGHWLEELSGLIQARRSGPMELTVRTAEGFEWLAVVYYAAKLDHLLSVPALICLFMGLRRLMHAPEPAGKIRERSWR